MNARWNNDPEEFWRIIEYRRLVDRDVFSDYYTVKGLAVPPAGEPRRWLAQLTSGRRFDVNGRLDPNRPIMFTQYSWPNGAQACRVPFSVSSLLETGSMNFESEMESTMLLGFDEDERIIEQISINNSRMNELYDVHWQYSTASASGANKLNISNAALAYPLAGSLASLCLNSPTTFLTRSECLPSSAHIVTLMWLPSDSEIGAICT